MFALRQRFCSALRGLKGRFCQPRPKAWESAPTGHVGPVRAVRLAPSMVNGPYRAEPPGDARSPGLRPGLTEAALQGAERGTTETKMDPFARRTLAVLISLFVVVPARADYLWVEGEKPVTSTMNRHPWWYDLFQKDRVSGGDLISNWHDSKP